MGPQSKGPLSAREVSRSPESWNFPIRRPGGIPSPRSHFAPTAYSDIPPPFFHTGRHPGAVPGPLASRARDPERDGRGSSALSRLLAVERSGRESAYAAEGQAAPAGGTPPGTDPVSCQTSAPGSRIRWGEGMAPGPQLGARRGKAGQGRCPVWCRTQQRETHPLFAALPPPCPAPGRHAVAPRRRRGRPPEGLPPSTCRRVPALSTRSQWPPRGEALTSSASPGRFTSSLLAVDDGHLPIGLAHRLVLS